MKRIAAFFLSLLLLLGISGCSGEQSGETPNNQPAGEKALSMVPAFPVDDVTIEYNTDVDARVLLYDVTPKMFLEYTQLMEDWGFTEDSVVQPIVDTSLRRYWARDSANGFRAYCCQTYIQLEDGSSVLVTYLEINEVQALLDFGLENPYMTQSQALSLLEQWLPSLPEAEWLTSNNLNATPNDAPDREYALYHYCTTLTLEDYTAHRAALQQAGFTLEPENIFEDGPFPNPNVDFFHVYRAKTQDGYSVSMQYLQHKDGTFTFSRKVCVPREKLLADPPQ